MVTAADRLAAQLARRRALQPRRTFGFGALQTVATAINLLGQGGAGGTSNVGVSLPASDANSLIGMITVTTNNSLPYAGTIALSGTNASSFSLSPTANVSSAPYPCSLYVGSVAIAAGTYAITLTATP